MKCVICKDGESHAGTATVTLERGGITLVLREVPAQVCDVCGERYFDEETSAKVRLELERAERAGQEVQVRSFAA